MAAKKKKKGKQSFKPVDFDTKFGVGQTGETTPQVVEVKKTFDEVQAAIKRELELVAIGLSKHCAMAIQFDDKKTPFCKVFGQISKDITTKQAMELSRLAFQDFGNKFAEFVKDELRHLF